jgi:hypothetical protein
MPSVAVVGASSDRSKFGNKAVRAYRKRGWTVYPVHPKEPEIEGARAYRSIAEIPGPLDRIVLYVPPQVGIALLEEIAASRPRELFVNPGAENEALLAKARALGLEPILACAIVEVGESPSAL